jgi:hypothetical protein
MVSNTDLTGLNRGRGGGARGANFPIYSVKIIIFLATELKESKYKTLGWQWERGVCVLQTGSDQSYHSF